MDRLLSVKDVAELLNMSSRTVYDHMRELGGFILQESDYYGFIRR